MTAKGPQAQRSSREPTKSLCVSSGPLTLDIRPLSAHQETLVQTILQLRSDGWIDRQIADHFNLIGWLTPRGQSWLPQSVFSMRKKYARRLETVLRLSELAILITTRKRSQQVKWAIHAPIVQKAGVAATAAQAPNWGLQPCYIDQIFHKTI